MRCALVRRRNRPHDLIHIHGDHWPSSERRATIAEVTRSRELTVLIGGFFAAITVAFWAVVHEPLPLLVAVGGALLLLAVSTG